MTDSVTHSAQPILIEVFLRSRASADTVEMLRETVTRLHRLEKRHGCIDVRVRTWSSVRPAIERLADTGPSVSRIVETFQSWADRAGYTLRPAFTEHQTPSRLGHDAMSEIRVPVVCVAVYEDGDLQYVAPCSDGDRIHTVDECLSMLEDDETDPVSDQDDPSEPPRKWPGDHVEDTAQESE
ncbi:HTH domain-containing protein [Natrinema gelatinilyticum]|uniref:HTH domain-containing protein n=1 Tax=Natrinema gelatinilyticum TaxID=2961571 RepID=UPI0030F38FC0